MIVNTKYGPMDDSQLLKREQGAVVEYYLNGELVHRSATIQLKGIIVQSVTQNFTR